jgi:hypothetical protein
MSVTDTLTELERARRDSAAQRLADYIEATVNAAPPLTEDQRQCIIAALRKGGDDAA